MNWNEHKPLIVARLKEKKELSEIAQELSAREKSEISEYVLKQFIHRNRLFQLNKQNRNLAFKIIKIKFRNPEYFRPTRDFFRMVGISQKRWWKLYRGEKEITELEFRRVSTHLGLSLEDVYEARQLNWIDDFENLEE